MCDWLDAHLLLVKSDTGVRLYTLGSIAHCMSTQRMPTLKHMSCQLHVRLESEAVQLSAGQDTCFGEQAWPAQAASGL